jgi:hypothetical protein
MGRSLDYSRIDPALLRCRFQPRSAAPRYWPARRSSRRDDCIRDWGGRYLPVDARAIGTDARQLAALVRIRPYQHHRCCTTRGWARCRCAAAISSERSHRRYVGARGSCVDDVTHHFAAGKSCRIMALRPALSWRPNCRLSMAIGGNWKRSSLTSSTTRSRQWTLRRIAIGYCR